MTAPRRRVLVTGAAGFLGRALTQALLDDPAHADARLVLLDVAPTGREGHRIEAVQGDFADPRSLDAAIGKGVDVAYHLAAVVGGAAEADYALARRVNVDATLALFERLRESGQRSGRVPRVVYASSIAVFGEPPPRRVDDDTVPRPTLVYGAQKHMMEIALAQFSARGWLDGLSLRLPAVVAKPAAPGTRAVFLNAVFHAFADGRSMTLPVSADGTTWLLSAPACTAALRHAGALDAAAIGRDRILTLPALRVTVGELVAALARRHPHGTTRIEHAPDPVLQAQFASQPPLATPAADRLGFRHDGDVDRLVARALTPAAAPA